jgi:oligosaccharyltransferase complex subunit alpha (ribophorin I)
MPETATRHPSTPQKTKQINLRSPVVAVTDALEVASSSSTTPSRFVLCYTSALAERLGYLELEVNGKPQPEWSRLSDAEVEALGAPGDPSAAGCFAFPLDDAARAALASSSSSKKAAKLSAHASFARALEPRPSTIAQSEPQRVLFRDAALRAVSPYRVEQQAIEALTPAGGKPLSFHPAAPVGTLKASSSGGIVLFSPSGATDAWGGLLKAGVDDKEEAKMGAAATANTNTTGASAAGAALAVHFLMDEPLVRGRRVVREVQVSHWGNVYFEETYLVRNDGPSLQGEFSRRRYSDRSAHKGHMFENLRARLPAGSRWIYYRDAIGNVSTSEVHRVPGSSKNSKNARASPDAPDGAVVVDLGQRYPMLGGWEADFVLGYSLPLGQVLSRVQSGPSAGKMRLRVSLPSPVEGIYVDELEVRVVLPEGAEAVAHAAPSAPNAAAALERKSTYLDAPWGPGRPVLVLRLANGVPDHGSARLTVEYSLTGLDMLRKPLLLAGSFAAVFAALALFNRADFSIAPPPVAPRAKSAGKAKAA